jgi:hypothetical protein
MQLGITGHQRLDDHAWQWVTEVMRQQVWSAEQPLVGVTSLAIGADQLFARLVVERGGTIHAVLPFADIERSFAPEDVASYRQLVQQATVEVLATPGTDEDAYMAAGQRVVDLSATLLAVWDGKPAKGKGGTADIVAYAMRRGVPVIHINPLVSTISAVTPP